MVLEAATIHEIDDQLELVETLEVSDLRLVTSVDECFECGLHQRARAAAQDRLLPERSVSVSSANVVSMTPARVQPMPRA